MTTCRVRTDGNEGWRRRVRRLAELIALHDFSQSEHFHERTCINCGTAVMVNYLIYPDDEPFSCGDGGYDPHAPRGRDAYWYAIALAGKDPDAVSGDARKISWFRRRKLRVACTEVGLTFGAP